MGNNTCSPRLCKGCISENIASKKKNLRKIGQLLTANFLLRGAGSATGVVVALYLTRINENVRPVTALEVGIIIAVSFNFMELTMSPLVGSMSDRYGSRWFMLIGVILAAIGVQLTALTTATSVLLFTRLLEGLGAALTTPLLLKHLTALTVDNDKLRSRIMILFELTTLSGFVLGSSMAGIGLSSTGLFTFSLISLVYLLTLPLFWSRRIYSYDIKTSEKGSIPYLKLLRSPLIWRFAPAWLALNAVIELWLSQIAFQLAGPQSPGQALVGNFNESQVSFIFAGYGIVIFAGLLVWALLLPGRRKTSVMTIALLGMVSASLAILNLNNPEVIGLPIQISLGWLAISVMVETGFAPASLAFLGDVSDSESWGRGRVMGIYNLLLGGGRLLGGWIGGLAAGQSAINGLSWSTIGLSILALMFVVSLHRWEGKTKWQ